MILGLEWGRAIDAGLPPQTWSRNSKWVFYDEQLLIRIQLGMDGGHIAESNVIASSHGGEHTGHVVEENLNRALGRRVLVLPLARVEGGVRYWAWRQRCSSIWGRGFVKILEAIIKTGKGGGHRYSTLTRHVLKSNCLYKRETTISSMQKYLRSIERTRMRYF